MASSSWCEETVEKINYIKLCRLLVDGGTQAVRGVFDGIHPSSSLTATLNANKTKLLKLKKPKGKVLNNEQWDKLYPPSGSNPKSEDFDITLLFVLLRSICGFTPPATGWDVLPPLTDTSPEANLAKVKYYRNEVAHKGNNEVNDTDFEQYWQDISSALVSLGLSQEDIDDLKSAPLGKKDYNQLMYDWYISDKDIKTQLKDLKSDTEELKSDTAGLKSDTAVIKSDTEELKSDTAGLKSDTAVIKSDTEELKSDTAGLKSDTAVIKSDTEELKSETAGLKSDTAVIKSDTEELKSDTAGLKSDTAVIKSDTEELKSDTAGLKSDTAFIKSDTGELKSDTAVIKSDTEELKSDTAVIMSDTADIKDTLNEVRNTYIVSHQMDKIINKLSFCDFTREISNKCQSFHPNTRQWILEQVKSHVDSDQPESCIMLITAGPGMGKSTIAAKICQTYKDLGCLGGCHFFQFSNSTRNNPRLMLQSIARQMCDTVAGYGKALERKLQTNLGKQITEMNCEELFTILLEEPLCQLHQTESNFVVVVDALDECSYNSKDELMKALRTKLPNLPKWLRFVITTRPSVNTSVLGSTVAVKILPDDQFNLLDLNRFFCSKLSALFPHFSNEGSEDILQKLVQMTKGLFLVAFYVVDFWKRENVSSPDEVLKLFPNGISSVYEKYFSRLKEVLLPYISEEEGFYKMLEAVVAAENPLPRADRCYQITTRTGIDNIVLTPTNTLPVSMFYNILGLKDESEVHRQEKKARKNALISLHWLFPVENDHVTVFHKSIVDWLILEGDEEHDFSVRVDDGIDVLANQCYDVLNDIRNGKKDLDKPLDLTDSEKYALVYVWNLFVATCESSINIDEKMDKFLNFHIIAAMIHAFRITKIDPVYTERSKYQHVFSIVNHGMFILCLRFYHGYDCPYFHPPSFGSYLEFVLQIGLVCSLSGPFEPNPLDALKEYSLPYCSFDDNKILKIWDTASKYCTLIHGKVLIDRFVKFGIVLEHQLDLYSYARTVPLTSDHRSLIAASPEVSLVVRCLEEDGIIEIIDVTTPTYVGRYQLFPHHQIETCHVFGDDRCWFIVIKGCRDNKIYVIEGLTNQVRHIITVSEDSKVQDVSRQGHILVTRTWGPEKQEEPKRLTNNHGDEVMRNLEITSYSPKKSITYKEMFLYHHERPQQPIPIYPLAQKICQCRPMSKSDTTYETAQFSDDGGLFAYHYNGCIFMINTTDGSLFKRLTFSSHLGCLEECDILFVSNRYVIVQMFKNNFRFLVLLDVSEDEIKHLVNIWYPMLDVVKLFLYFKEEEEVVNAVGIDRRGLMIKLEFHNLRL